MDKFNHISQRVIFAYLIAFSDFHPIESDKINEEAQRHLYELMGDLQKNLYSSPELLGLPMDEDRAYPWGVSSNQHPELNQIYMTIFKVLYDFYHYLYVTAVNGEMSENSIYIAKDLLKTQKASYKPVYQKILNSVGIEVAANKLSVTLSHAGVRVFGALKLLGKNNEKEFDQYKNNPISNLHHNLFCFAACCFDGKLDYLLNHIDELYALNGLLPKLRQSCEQKGYTYDTEVKLGSTDFGMNIMMSTDIGGFRVVYNPRKEDKVRFGTQNGIGEKAMIEHFEDLPQEMQEHFIEICKRCSGCKYCTKGGKNKMFTVNVQFGGEKYHLCPMFPQHEWASLDQALIDRLMVYHDLQRKYA